MAHVSEGVSAGLFPKQSCEGLQQLNRETDIIYSVLLNFQINVLHKFRHGYLWLVQSVSHMDSHQLGLQRPAGP